MEDNWTDFCGTRIDLSKRPLYPRPETEYWVNEFLSSRTSLDSSRGPSSVRILDIFTGSGCIGITVATHVPNSQVVLSDKTNYISTPLPPNCSFIQSDLFEKVNTKFDYILANPPYVPEGGGVGPTSDGVNIMDTEPHDALYAGTDGLGVIRPFLEQAHKHLNPGGEIWLEFGNKQEDTIGELLQSLPYKRWRFCPDQYGTTRFAVIQCSHARD